MPDEFEDEYYVADDGDRQGWRERYRGFLSTSLGALMALAVIAGLGYWAYRLVRVDASAVPVIRAALEPAKRQADDPGGAEIAHQDITSYTAGDGESAPAEVGFAAPPERPAEEDVAMGAAQGGETIAPATAPAAEAEAKPEPKVPPSDATEQAPEASPVAPTRPSDLSRQMAVARQAISEEAELAARAAASAVKIQLGAFPERNLTEAEWDRIFKANQDILSGRALVVQGTTSGGRRFFRLRAGPFTGPIEAQNVCWALQARGQSCLVVVNG